MRRDDTQGVDADLYVTGEMGHHRLLDAVSFGRSVMVCNHSNTERGYLKELKQVLETELGEDYELFLSTVDHDPLTVVYSVCNKHAKRQNKQINLYDDVFFRRQPPSIPS